MTMVNGKTARPLIGAIFLIVNGLGTQAAGAYLTVEGNYQPPGGTCSTRVLDRYIESETGFGTVTGTTEDHHRDSQCPSDGIAFSSASMGPGWLKAYSSAAGYSYTEASAELGVLVQFGGPRGATSVGVDEELVVAGTLTEDRYGQHTSGWSGCVTAWLNETNEMFKPVCNHGFGGSTSGSFSTTIPLHLVALPAVNGRVDVYLRFQIKAFAYGAYNANNNIPTFDIGIADLTHTAYIRQTLPPGWTFTADSDIFLSESPFNTPVPEPTSLALLGSGLSVLAGLRIRRARRAPGQV